ncbi:MAG TPA: 2-dehydropantoate 2-reductase [Candidatus Baltobacterales bacterium]|nr:2-dehydropantoate 2-reductase [Candidatus Baltobacterales bacterium]
MSAMGPESLRFAVLGPGGVGGLLAALLARAGNSVVVIAGEETSRVIAERGIRLESKKFGDFTVPVRTATRLAETVDACFITVKATQLDQALERVPAPALGAGLLVPFLNGIDHVARLRAVYPPASVVAATIRVETARVEPGLIRQLSPFAAVELAASDGNRERVDAVAAQLRATGLDVRVRGDETPMLWDKLAMLAPLALLTTHERGNAGAVRTRRRDDAVAVITEVVAVARAEGGTVDAESVIRLLDSAPASMESSMQRDQAAGRPLEVDAIGGAVVRHAEKKGIAVPMTRRLVDELEARSKRPAT